MVNEMKNYGQTINANATRVADSTRGIYGSFVGQQQRLAGRYGIRAPNDPGWGNAEASAEVANVNSSRRSDLDTQMNFLGGGVGNAAAGVRGG